MQEAFYTGGVIIATAFTVTLLCAPLIMAVQETVEAIKRWRRKRRGYYD